MLVGWRSKVHNKPTLRPIFNKEEKDFKRVLEEAGLRNRFLYVCRYSGGHMLDPLVLTFWKVQLILRETNITWCNNVEIHQHISYPCYCLGVVLFLHSVISWSEEATLQWNNLLSSRPFLCEMINECLFYHHIQIKYSPPLRSEKMQEVIHHDYSHEQGWLLKLNTSSYWNDWKDWFKTDSQDLSRSRNTTVQLKVCFVCNFQVM